MITCEQIEEADFLCKQARESVAIAHNCWSNLAASYNSLVRSYKAAGLSHDDAMTAFEASMENQRASFVAALKHLERTNDFYNQLRLQFDRAGT
jgi:hypothetical protein